jgi:hypothetical protein
VLTMSSYPADYVAASRSRVRSDVAAFEANGAPTALAPPFFANMLLALECAFVHRTRAVEGKDAVALKEVRLVTNSLLLHGGVLTEEKAIKLDATTTVLGIPYGDKIVLDAESFTHLADTFFDELGSRFVSD